MSGTSTRLRCAGMALVFVATFAAALLAGGAPVSGASGWTISPGPESITVSWSGFSQGESLDVALSGGGAKFNCSSSSGSCTAKGLTDGTSYTVNALVSDSTGTVSSTSGVAIPFTTPGAVTIGVTVGDATIVVNWNPPADDGGSSVLQYVAEATGATGVRTCTGTGGSCTITGLVNGAQYSVRAAAVNAAGQGLWSASVLTTPIAAPGAVAGVAVERDRADRLFARWTGPANDGGSPITGFVIRYSSDAGATWTQAKGASGQLLAGVDETATYLVEVAALNAAGQGPWSPATSGAPMVVSPTRSSLSVTRLRTTRGGTFSIVVHLKDASGLVVAGRTVSLSRNAHVVLQRTDKRGVAHFEVRGKGTQQFRVASGPMSIGAVRVDFTLVVTASTTTTLAGATSTTTSTTTTSTAASTTTTTRTATSVTSTSVGPGTTRGRATVDISFNGGVGWRVSQYRVNVTGRGLTRWAGEAVLVSVHSRGIVVGRTHVNSDGTFDAVVLLPSTLRSGEHSLIVRVTTPGQVAAKAFYVVRGRVSAIGAPFGPLAAYVPFAPGRHVGELLGIVAGLMVAMAALGARARRRSSDSGGLVDVELDRLRDDESTPTVNRVRVWLEEWSRTAPSRWSRLSPVLGRVASDGDYLRALLGSVWLVGCVTAVALGAVAAHSSQWYPTVPTWQWLAGLTALGVLDAAWGILAGAAWASALVVGGHLNSPRDARGMLGVVLLWFAVALAAGSIAPLRRRVRSGLRGAWVRASDFVVASAFGGFVALEMSRALAPLFGAELSGVVRPGAIALVAMGAVVLRMMIETVVAHRGATRLGAMEHEGDFVAGRGQMALSLAVQIAVFWFVSMSVVNGWTLVVGTLVFFAPLIAGLRDWRPIPWIRDHEVTAPVRWSLVIAAGYALAWLIEHARLHDRATLNVGFVVLALPVVSTWILELFQGDDDEGATAHVNDREFRWGRQVLGVVMVAALVWLVMVRGVGGQ